MFTFQNFVDNTVQGSKAALSYVTDVEMRKSLNNLVDANAKFVTTIAETNLELAKMVVEKIGEYEYAKPYAELTKKAMANII